MITPAAFRKMALSFEEAEAAPHFEKESFRIRKKIFVTLNVPEKRATLKLSLIDQSVFCSHDMAIVFPVPNKWGKQGWTHVNLTKVRKEMLEDALRCAYCEVAPPQLAAKYQAS